jgi:hypothetical protein
MTTLTLHVGDIVTALSTPYHDLIGISGRRYFVCHQDTHEGRPHYWGHPERLGPVRDRKGRVIESSPFDRSQDCPLGDGSGFRAPAGAPAEPARRIAP